MGAVHWFSVCSTHQASDDDDFIVGEEVKLSLEAENRMKGNQLHISILNCHVCGIVHNIILESGYDLYRIVSHTSHLK